MFSLSNVMVQYYVVASINWLSSSAWKEVAFPNTEAIYKVLPISDWDWIMCVSSYIPEIASIVDLARIGWTWKLLSSCFTKVFNNSWLHLLKHSRNPSNVWYLKLGFSNFLSLLHKCPGEESRMNILHNITYIAEPYHSKLLVHCQISISN